MKSNENPDSEFYMPVVHIPLSVYTGISQQGEASYPEEACGLLTGVFSPCGNISLYGFHPSRNLAEDPLHAFVLDPVTQFAVQKAARCVGQSVVGLYHSHPNGQAQLSVHDKKNAASHHFLWMIIAVAPTTETVIRCYLPPLHQEGFIEMPVVLL